MKTALVLGAGGFIGTHLVRRLKSEGYWVRGVDIKLPEFSETEADEFLIYDLSSYDNVIAVMRLDKDMTFTYLPKPYGGVPVPFDEVYQLAADMGGAGYIFTGEHDAQVMFNSSRINLNVCDGARIFGAGKIFFSSSACIYPQEIQNDYTSEGLKESDAYPANPDSCYGWEKIFSEILYDAFARNHGLNIRVARFHNIYGPEGTWFGGREKAPAAMCRKAIEAGIRLSEWESKNKGTADFVRWMGAMPTAYIEVWGTGHQTRSFLYIDDCIDAVRLLMESDYSQPINIGSEEMITINALAQLAIGFENRKIGIKNITGPVGVNGRNSDNTLVRRVLNWEPKHTLTEGLAKTFQWIKWQYENNYGRYFL